MIEATGERQAIYNVARFCGIAATICNGVVKHSRRRSNFADALLRSSGL